jgi:hypothetical protein
MTKSTETTRIGGDDIDWFDEEALPIQARRNSIRDDFERLDEMKTEAEISDLIERLEAALGEVGAQIEGFKVRREMKLATEDDARWLVRARVASQYYTRYLKLSKKALTRLRHEEQQRQQQEAKAKRLELRLEKPDASPVVAENNKNARFKAKLAFIRRFSWETKFVDVAKETLPQEVFMKLVERTHAAISDELDALQAECESPEGNFDI